MGSTSSFSLVSNFSGLIDSSFSGCRLFYGVQVSHSTLGYWFSVVFHLMFGVFRWALGHLAVRVYSGAVCTFGSSLVTLGLDLGFFVIVISPGLLGKSIGRHVVQGVTVRRSHGHSLTSSKVSTEAQGPCSSMEFITPHDMCTGLTASRMIGYQSTCWTSLSSWHSTCRM